MIFHHGGHNSERTCAFCAIDAAASRISGETSLSAQDYERRVFISVEIVILSLDACRDNYIRTFLAFLLKHKM